jgi:formate dehydrogenase iron-sulfur subunit
MEAWKKYSNLWVVFAVTLFVYLMSRDLGYTAAAFAVFGFLAYAFRNKPGQKPVPVLLAIAAVTLSAMHQSSLGSLFLLMPDKLNHLWWSPIMPVYFFVSSIAAGVALVILVEMWIAKAWDRPLRTVQLAAVGKIAFLALLAYLALRIGDLGVRGQLANAGTSALFLVEMAMAVAGLFLLASPKVRENPRLLGLASFLSMGSIVLNRINVVVGGMNLKGTAPQLAPEAYFPSVVEWGISLGLIAATIFLFGLGARLMPVLPAESAASSSPMKKDQASGRVA